MSRNLRIVIFTSIIAILVRVGFCGPSYLARAEAYTNQFQDGMIVFLSEVRRNKEDVPGLEVRFRQWEDEALITAFSDGEPITIESNKVSGAEFIDDIPIIAKEYENDSGKEISAFPNGTLQYRSGKMPREFESTVDEIIYKRWENNREIDGFSLDAAVSALHSRLEKLGIEPGDIISYCGIDQAAYDAIWERKVEYGLYVLEDILQEEQSVIDEWRAERSELFLFETQPQAPEVPVNGYVLYIEQNYDGTPCIPDVLYSSEINDNLYGSAAMAFVSEHGLDYLMIDGDIGCYEILNRQEIQLISLDEAVDAVVKKYKNILLEQPIIFDRISLSYVPASVPNKSFYFQLRPAWCFYPVNDGGQRWNPTYIDAYNGKEIR